MKLSIEEKLVQQAISAFKHAYAPYSQFHVGAALVTKNGVVYHGCNVENASYGLTTCAERNCIASAVVENEKSFETLVIYTEQDELVPPCGACRQVISEFFSPQATISAINHKGEQKHWQVQELLPNAFTPKFLDK
ncbi:cytidine deaminase [Thalassotalea ganghwensis]